MYEISGFLFRVFEVRDFGYGVSRFGFSGSLVFEVRGFWFSVKGFRGSGFMVYGSRYGVLEVWGFGFGVTWIGVRCLRYGVLEVRGFRVWVSGSLFGVSGAGCAVRGFHG